MSEILKPETVTAREAQEARAHKLLRRQIAQNLIPALLTASLDMKEPHPGAVQSIVEDALALADALIAKTGGPG